MARRVFFSFHFKPDSWRAAQVRNMGIVEGDEPVSDNDWESIKKSGDDAIKEWIEDQMKGKSCVVVLIGEKTSTRRWVKYEAKRGWELGKGVVGIYVHGLKDQNGQQSTKGSNPFDSVTINGKKMSNLVKSYDPPYSLSTNVYNYIKNHIADWVEEAIDIRKNS